jgi:hypothetical protein
MQYNWDVIGHERQREFLEKVAASGRVAHAYLFVGPPHIGKTTVAEQFARMLQCEDTLRRPCGTCELCTHTVNPDFLFIEEPLKISIDRVREVLQHLSLRPYRAAWKVAIIASAENLTREAAAALLKTLEEPSSRSLLMLIAPSSTDVLPTIVSRCMRLRFSSVYEKTGHGKKIPNFILQNGRPGLALRYEREKVFKKGVDGAHDTWEQFMSGDLTERIVLMHELAAFKTEEIAQRLDLWLLAAHSQNDSASSVYASQIIQASQRIKMHMNHKLVLANLAVTTSHI